MRRERWEIVLADQIEAARSRPFAWGTFDCAAWAFSVAALLRGEDIPEWIGTYSTEIGAKRLLSKNGIKDLVDLGDRIMGERLETPLKAWRGDVVFSQGAYGICIGTHSAHTGRTDTEGLVAVPMGAAEAAWRV